MKKRDLLERLYTCLSGYQQSVQDAAFNLGSTAQDMGYILEELEQLIDQERYHESQ